MKYSKFKIYFYTIIFILSLVIGLWFTMYGSLSINGLFSYGRWLMNKRGITTPSNLYYFKKMIIGVVLLISGAVGAIEISKTAKKNNIDLTTLGFEKIEWFSLNGIVVIIFIIIFSLIILSSVITASHKIFVEYVL